MHSTLLRSSITNLAEDSFIDSDKEGADKEGSIRKDRLTKGLVMKERIGDEGQISKGAKGRLEQKG